ncbi:MAG TPA: hypothetical protein PLA50_20050 [Bacteroidia bacterium]|nr:hypothetical protein [Bacteroidia bacterium]
MKLTILATAAAAVMAVFGATNAEAGGRYRGGYGYGPSYGYGGGHSHCAPAPVYKTCTVEVCRERQCRTAYDHCGRPYSYHVTVVTYCDHYSNGTSRTWTRVFS